VVVALEHATETVEQAAAARLMAARLFATTARLTSTALFAAAALLFAAAARLATTIVVTAQATEKRVGVSGNAEHQGDAERREGNTSVHREGLLK